MKKLIFVFIIGVLLITVSGQLNGQALRNKIKSLVINRVKQQNEKYEIASPKFSLEHDGRTRTYYVYEPSSWDKKSPIPLVFLFHGGGGNGKNALYFYELEHTAEKHGFLLVSADGTGENEDVLLTWNVGFGFGYAHENNVDDFGFIQKLINTLENKYPINPDRIYATGLSNGAYLCHFLAAQPENRFAAIAPVVGSIGGSHAVTGKIVIPPPPTTPVSVCNIVGVVDRNVPVNGGLQERSIQEPRNLLSASDTLRFWVEANGCTAEPEIRYDNQLKSTIITHRDGRAGTTVISYLIDNNGHAWPGSSEKPHRGADIPAPQFPTNEIIWEFFKNHPRRLQDL